MIPRAGAPGCLSLSCHTHPLHSLSFTRSSTASAPENLPLSFIHPPRREHPSSPLPHPLPTRAGVPGVQLCVQLYRVHRPPPLHHWNLALPSAQPIQLPNLPAAAVASAAARLYSPVVYHFILVPPPELVYCILCCAAPTVARHMYLLGSHSMSHNAYERRQSGCVRSKQEPRAV